jgi:hypothetical protein
MNKLYIGFLIIGIIPFITGCSSVKGIFGKSSTKETIARDKIIQVDDSISKANTEKLNQIGQYSYGISIVSNVPPPATVLNDRISSLSNPLTVEDKKSMKEIVNELETNNFKLLLKKDKVIKDLQNSQISLINAKEDAINNYIKLAGATAMQTDSLTAALKEYQGWFGLKAVVKGMGQFIKSSMWFLAIGGILFVILRLLATANPVAGALFSLFEQIVSWGVKTIQWIFPKAVSMAGFVAEQTYATTKSALVKVVDAVEIAKLKGINVSPIKEEISKTMDTTHKDIISSIKQELNY